MITTKTLPLVLKAATATMPASVVGQRPTIAMVTAINSQKAVLSTDVQNTPVNLQTSSKVTGPGAEAVQIVAKNTVTLVSQQLLLMCVHTRGFRLCIVECFCFRFLLGFSAPIILLAKQTPLWGCLLTTELSWLQGPDLVLSEVKVGLGLGRKMSFTKTHTVSLFSPSIILSTAPSLSPWTLSAKTPWAVFDFEENPCYILSVHYSSNLNAARKYLELVGVHFKNVKEI